MRLPRVNRQNKCKICGHSDWCGISPDGKLALCMRIESMKQAKNGAFIHLLDESAQIPPSLLKTPKQAKRLSDEHLNEVYQSFLDRLGLSIDHRANLRNRGIGCVSTVVHGYRSNPLPKFANTIAEQLSKIFMLEGVPGFYFEKGKWKFQTYGGLRGFLTPIRNSKFQIVALQLRSDNGQKWQNEPVPKYLPISSYGKNKGTSSGAPHHFAILGKTFKRDRIEEILITEGALKANVISEFISDKPVIGLISVTTFDENLPYQLKQVFPNLRAAKIAFDMEVFDKNNPDGCAYAHVDRQRKRLVSVLAKQRIKSVIGHWDSNYKGLDDFLLYQSKSSRVITI